MVLFWKYVFIFTLMANWQQPLLLLMVNSLTCDVCEREGGQGSYSCHRMPCNNGRDVDRAQWMLTQASNRIHNRMTEEPTNVNLDLDLLTKCTGLLEHFNRMVDTNHTNCVKFVGRISRNPSRSSSSKANGKSVPFIRASCDFVNLLYPPQRSPDPYTFIPEIEVINLLIGVKLENYEASVCDEKAVHNCRVSREELKRSGANINRKAGLGPFKFNAAAAIVIMISCFMFLVGAAAEALNPNLVIVRRRQARRG